MFRIFGIANVLEIEHRIMLAYQVNDSYEPIFCSRCAKNVLLLFWCLFRDFLQYMYVLSRRIIDSRQFWHFLLVTN